MLRQSRLGGPGAPELAEFTPASLLNAAPPADEAYVPGGGYGGYAGGGPGGGGGGGGGFGGGGGSGGGGGGGGSGGGPGAPTVTPAPEPQTWALLSIGVALAGLALRRLRSGRAATA